MSPDKFYDLSGSEYEFEKFEREVDGVYSYPDQREIMRFAKDYAEIAFVAGWIERSKRVSTKSETERRTQIKLAFKEFSE